MLSCLAKTSDRYLLKLACKPAQRKTCIRSISEDLIHVHVAAVALDGKANEELLAYLSWLTGVDRGEAKITSGQTSRFKTVALRCRKDYSTLLATLQSAVE